MFTYIPKKSKEIYNNKIAHRGFHYIYPENSLRAYSEAINKNMSIELDLRMTKDGYIICMHDRYTKRLLGVKGRTTKMLFKDIEKFYIKKSCEKVPLFEEVLKLICGKVPLLIEVKGYATREFLNKLMLLIFNYNGKVYFHAKNIFTYFFLRRIWLNKVFYILNPFRKRFNFIKNKYYKNLKLITKYYFFY